MRRTLHLTLYEERKQEARTILELFEIENIMDDVATSEPANICQMGFKLLGRLKKT